MVAPAKEKGRLLARWQKLEEMVGRSNRPDRIEAWRVEQVEIVRRLRVVAHEVDVAEGRARTCPTCRRPLNKRLRLEEQGHAEGCRYMTSIVKLVDEAPPLTADQIVTIKAILGPVKIRPWALPPDL